MLLAFWPLPNSQPWHQFLPFNTALSQQSNFKSKNRFTMVSNIHFLRNFYWKRNSKLQLVAMSMPLRVPSRSLLGFFILLCRPHKLLLESAKSDLTHGLKFVSNFFYQSKLLKQITKLISFAWKQFLAESRRSKNQLSLLLVFLQKARKRQILFYTEIFFFTVR